MIVLIRSSLKVPEIKPLWAIVGLLDEDAIHSYTAEKGMSRISLPHLSSSRDAVVLTYRDGRARPRPGLWSGRSLSARLGQRVSELARRIPVFPFIE